MILEGLDVAYPCLLRAVFLEKFVLGYVMLRVVGRLPFPILRLV